MIAEAIVTESGITRHGTAWTVTGTGEPVVLIHGVGMQQGVWGPQVLHLARTHQVLVYDMLGHGASLPAQGAPILADYANQLVELLDELGISSASVAGHSMGALVALEFALAHPQRSRRVAALNAVYRRTQDQRDAVLARAQALRECGAPATAGPTLARWFGDPVPPELQRAATEVAGYLEGVQPLGYAQAYAVFASSDEAHVGKLDKLVMPALFCTGEYDANSSPAMAQAMAAEAPIAMAEVIPGARHMMNVTDAEAVNASLSRWLDTPVAS
ncbi:alpha/beta fold hydrolase [Hydrogenophaga atypica]|jgi:pimeloyl-ACP methyl ester carboxylesterase|uniref:Alpha/beta fold hydrolase n=1 Tax=Hydrogenophaga atypica TaxID=249409 RepID=A0ABW2QR35_9BURK